MAQGDISNTIQSGGQLPPNGSQQARTIIGMGCCTLGTPGTLYNLGSSPAIVSSLDTGALADYCAKILQHGAGAVYALPVTPSAVGGISAAVTQVGSGTGTVVPSIAPHKQITVLCTLGGVLGTMKVQFSLDGGVTYGAVTTSAAGWATTGILVPGTYITLTFGAATYVATKTATVGIDASITLGSGWVGAVAILTTASSPIDNYNVLVTVVNGGALGTATVSISLDGGLTALPNAFVPASGVLSVPGTGLALTLASTFVAGNTYSFLATGPSFSTSDVTTALNAVRALATTPTVALLHVIALPASAAGAISMASTIDSALATLATSQFQRNFSGLVECPSSVAGDTVMSGANCIVDSADTDTIIRTARAGSTFLRTSVCVATQEQKNVNNSWNLRRPVGWGLAARYVEADPASDPSWVLSGPLDFTLVNGSLRRDEFSSGVTLYDAQFNALKTYPNRAGAYLTIESGGVGWRNMNTLQGWQDANFIRLLNVFLSAITVAGQKYLGSRQPTDPDGTITAVAAGFITADLDNIAKLTVGLSKGGSFTGAQASAASATCLGTSQLNLPPRRLDIAYSLQSQGFVSAISDTISIS